MWLVGEPKPYLPGECEQFQRTAMGTQDRNGDREKIGADDTPKRTPGCEQPGEKPTAPKFSKFKQPLIPQVIQKKSTKNQEGKYPPPKNGENRLPSGGE